MKSYLIIIGVNLLNIFNGFLLIPKRLFNLAKHISYFGYKKTYNHKSWFYPILVLFSFFDSILAPELLNFLMCLLKPNSRLMSTFEINEAKKVFGNSINYNLIAIDESSLLAKIGAKYVRQLHLGFVFTYHINFSRKISCQKKQTDTEWLIHELTHILQMKHIGSSYIFYALYAQHTDGYTVENIEQKEISDFNFEQQAEICKFHYKFIKSDKSNKRLSLFVHLIRNNQFT